MDDIDDLLLLLLLHQLMLRASLLEFIIVYYYMYKRSLFGRRPRRAGIRYSLISRIPDQIKYLDNALNKKEDSCKNNFRMNRSCFLRLCHLLLSQGGLQPSKYVNISEQVAIFLDILSHHTKNRRIGHHFNRSGETVSKYFKRVMFALLKLHPLLVSKPVPIDCDEDNLTWNKYEGCLGALDGSYFKVQVPLVDKPRYRSRKGVIATNVLCACDREGVFSYILTGWEGSAADGRVLKDAISRPNGFHVPIGQYYLCDGGYTNGPGFLAPYRGVRYHLKEWADGRRAPQNYQEYFNMKHSKARGVIERAFGSLKKKWGILASTSFYPIKTQNHIIMATVLLHNFVRTHGGYEDSDSSDGENTDDEDDPSVPPSDYVQSVEPSESWTAFRETLAQEMYNEWQAIRR